MLFFESWNKPSFWTNPIKNNQSLIKVAFFQGPRPSGTSTARCHTVAHVFRVESVKKNQPVQSDEVVSSVVENVNRHRAVERCQPAAMTFPAHPFSLSLSRLSLFLGQRSFLSIASRKNVTSTIARPLSLSFFTSLRSHITRTPKKKVSTLKRNKKYNHSEIFFWNRIQVRRQNEEKQTRIGISLYRRGKKMGKRSSSDTQIHSVNTATNQ